MADSLHVLLSSDDPNLTASAKAISPRIVLHTPADLEADPKLLSEVEVAYGGIGRSRVAEATSLRWLQLSGAGVNGLITPEIRDSELVITNASGIHAEPITEHMFAMLLMVTRNLAQAWEQQKAHAWNSGELAKPVDLLAGKTLGVLGVGAIGGHSARVGQGFAMRVLGLRRGGEPHPHVEKMYTPEQRLEFFRETDVVMNSLPLTERTRHFMGWEEFAALKPGAIVANTGRGGTIHTEVMMASLREGRLGAALLDVTDPEPLPPDHPLWSMENVYITPHYSGNHPGYYERAGKIFLENLRRYVAGEELVNVVDKHEGY
jgi:phosphoglycerate dehydrogenase-like enzyme